MNRPEVLAPVASRAMLDAAIRCGADAVYLGIGRFNARQHANDFGELTLSEIVRICHVRGVRVHLALNTLVRQEELPDALQTAREACEAGVDALIVQDLGLARLIHRAAPTMPLHASTQCSCHTPQGVRELVAHGFSRVVLARELSRPEIAACIGQGAEIEVFVHGALCMSMSGQCAFSAMLGGRSGNRGLCAQTCRLPFSPVKDDGRPAQEGEACLSLRDLSLREHVQELAAMGVDSLKIEGRRKRPEYVAAATAVYRAAVDGRAPDVRQQQDLQAVFSRSGFTDAYYTGRRGAALFGIRRKEDVVAAAEVQDRLAETYRAEVPRVPVGFRLDLAADRPAQLLAWDQDGHRATVVGAVPIAAERPMSEQRAAAQLGKTGGTPYALSELSVQSESGLTLPASALNALRREALAALTQQRGESKPIPWQAQAATPLASTPTVPAQRSGEWWARLADARQLTEEMATRLQRVFLPLDTAPEQLRFWSQRVAVGVEIPRALWGREETVRQALETARQAGATSALCGNIGAIPLAREAGLDPVGGFGLNITNTQTLSALQERGLTAATLSQELTFRQMMLPWPGRVGAILYGHQPLMLTRYCPRKAAAGCRDCEGARRALVDRKGVSFPLECHGDFTEVLNAVGLWWADRPQDWPPLDFILLHLTTETPQEAERVLALYQSGGKSPTPEFTRGLYRRGVE